MLELATGIFTHRMTTVVVATPDEKAYFMLSVEYLVGCGTVAVAGQDLFDIAEPTRSSFVFAKCSEERSLRS